MNRILKRLLSLSVMTVFILEQAFFSVTHAQSTEFVQCEEYKPNCSTSSVCSSHSEEFQIYVNFILDTVSTLKGLAIQQEIVEDMPTDGLFSNNVLSLPKNQLTTLKFALKLGIEDFQKGLNALTAGFAISFDIGKESLGDTWAAFKMLFRTKPFVREYGVLLDMEAYLHDLMYELSVDGRYSKKIDSEGIENLQKVFNEYSSSQPLFSVASIKDDTTYADVVRMLFDLTSTMKIFIGKRRKANKEYMAYLTKKNNAFVNAKKWGDTMLLQFDTNTICVMDKKYLCAADACDISWSQIWKDISDVGIIKSAATESLDMIDKANKELAKALAKIKDNIKNKNKNKNNPNIGLTDYQQELLRTVYGIDTTKLTKKQGIGLSDIFTPSNLTKSIKIKGALEVVDILAKENQELQDASTEDAKAEMAATAALRTLAKENKETLLGEIDAVGKYVQPSGLLTGSLYAAMNDVIDAHMGTFNRMLFGQTTDITRHYKEIGVFIQNTIADYIGTKDTDGLVKKLGQTCEIQCANKGNVNCYAE